MKRRETGMAVVVAIMLVALAATTAALMLSQQDLWARQVESLGARAQADAAARAGIEWARRALAEGAAELDAGAGQRMMLGALMGPATADASLDIRVTDAQALFNINNLVRGDRASEPDLQAFRRLLIGTGLSPDLANAVVDAIDGDSETTLPGGAEDLDYLAMTPPQRAANRPMTDVAHLARVKGFTAEAVLRLSGLIVALPESTPVNVNTAPAGVLMMIVADLAPEAAERLVRARADKPYADVEAFRASLPEKARPIEGIPLTVASRYFLVSSSADVKPVRVAYQALVGKPGAGHSGVVWRRQGGE